MFIIEHIVLTYLLYNITYTYYIEYNYIYVRTMKDKGVKSWSWWQQGSSNSKKLLILAGCYCRFAGGGAMPTPLLKHMPQCVSLYFDSGFFFNTAQAH